MVKRQPSRSGSRRSSSKRSSSRRSAETSTPAETPPAARTRSTRRPKTRTITTEKRLHSFDYINFALFFAFINMIFTCIGGVVFGIMALLSGEPDAVMLVLIGLIGGLIGGFIAGFISGLFTCLLYNLAAKMLGGLVMNISEEAYLQ